MKARCPNAKVNPNLIRYRYILGHQSVQQASEMRRPVCMPELKYMFLNKPDGAARSLRKVICERK